MIHGMKQPNGKQMKLPPGMAAFDQTMRKLVRVPKAELEAEEKKYERRKAALKRRRSA